MAEVHALGKFFLQAMWLRSVDMGACRAVIGAQMDAGLDGWVHEDSGVGLVEPWCS